VPNRFEYGYGLTPEIVAVAAQQQPDLIITVDNGISSVEGVAAARARGIAVLITDHHLPGSVLPQADAMVNPNQPGDNFPSKSLAGVGVIFYVMLALRSHLRETGWFTRPGVKEPNLAKLLDLVALGTVADVVPLDYNNRILVAQGLMRINQGLACPGISALLAVAGRKPGGSYRLAANDLGFYAAPRLNAAGRLQDMSLGIACLLSDDSAAAELMAQQLDELNRARRVIEQDMQQQALAALQTLKLDAGVLPKGLCLFNEDWHQGVIGIVAGRLKDRLHRPVIALAPANAVEVKGSARSVPGLHIRDALDTIAARHPHLLQKFGGHAMAAGLSLRRADIPEFSAAFDAEVSRHLDEADLQGHILSDGALSRLELDIVLAEAVRQGGPWGQGFPEPLFDGEFEIIDRRVVGEKHLKMILRHIEGGKNLEAIAFNQATALGQTGLTRVHAAYKLDVNEYSGYRALQLIVEHMQPVV
jgi:single-stranded-DNA-specific exonuclease